jgi:hypothetical protein
MSWAGLRDRRVVRVRTHGATRGSQRPARGRHVRRPAGRGDGAHDRASCRGFAGDFKDHTPATPQGERRKWDQAAVLWPRLPVAASHEAVWSRSGVLGHLLLAPTRLSGAPW